MRTKGANTKKVCWSLKIYYPDYVVKEGTYTTLQDVADDLGLSYNQVSEMTNKGRNKTKSKYSFYPTIDLKKICDIGAIPNLLPNQTEDIGAIPNLLPNETEDY
jgi:hypothetical protein